MVAPVGNPIPLLSRSVAQSLDQIRSLLPAGWNVTLVCADPANIKNSFMLSNDTLERLDAVLAHVRSAQAGWTGEVRG